MEKFEIHFGFLWLKALSNPHPALSRDPLQNFGEGVGMLLPIILPSPWPANLCTEVLSLGVILTRPE